MFKFQTLKVLGQIIRSAGRSESVLFTLFCYHGLSVCWVTEIMLMYYRGGGGGFRKLLFFRFFFFFFFFFFFCIFVVVIVVVVVVVFAKEVQINMNFVFCPEFCQTQENIKRKKMVFIILVVACLLLCIRYMTSNWRWSDLTLFRRCVTTWLVLRYDLMVYRNITLLLFFSLLSVPHLTISQLLVAMLTMFIAI